MSKKSLLVFLLFFLVSGCGLVASLILTKERQIVEKRAAGGQGAYLSLLPSLTVGNGQEFSLPVMLGTDGVEIIGVDVVLNFDKNYLELTNIIPGPEARPNPYTPPFGTYLPVDNNGNFNVQAVKNSANASGKIEIGAVAFNWANEQVTSGFNGTLNQANPLFTLKFKAKQGGQTSVNFSFTPGSTTDSNLVRINGDQVQDILSQVTNLSITITSTTPTPTSGPTHTPTPTPRPTTTPTPTLTPTPEPTNTPTPTSPPNTASLNFKLKFQGINQQRTSKTVKVVLKQQGQEKYRFNALTVNSDANGVYSGTLTNITPGTYDIFVKGWAHLQKKFGNVNLVSGTNTQDWTGTTLKAGDFNNEGETGYNILNIDDIAKISAVYTALNVPVTTSNQIYDVNLDNKISIEDIALVLANYTALNVQGD